LKEDSSAAVENRRFTVSKEEKDSSIAGRRGFIGYRRSRRKKRIHRLHTKLKKEDSSIGERSRRKRIHRLWTKLKEEDSSAAGEVEERRGLIGCGEKSKKEED
jgi:hypothetical protein